MITHTLVRKAALTAVVAAAGSGLLSSATVTGAQPEPAGALRILLTNDDGWNRGGLPSLREALVGAGYDVVVFAPADDQTGNAGRLTIGRPLVITQEAEGVFSVGGSPADSAEAGLSMAFPGELPDLVVSGPNAGANIGNVTIHSGTIGAAVTSANEGVPAIAVSTNGDPVAGGFDYRATNAFVLDLVAALAAHAGDGPLLPDRLALNVNVPFVAECGAPAGVDITTSDDSYIDVDYSGVTRPGVGESVDAAAAISVTPTVNAGSDSAALDAGRIAITFVQGNYDVTHDPAVTADVETLTPLLAGLVPSAPACVS